MTPTLRLGRWRWVALLFGALYALSVTLLLIAATAATAIPGGTITLLGLLDVGTAFAVVAAGWALTARAAPLVGPFARRWSYGVASLLPTAVLVAMWLAQDHLRWNVLLPGLAWRVYILLACLPAALAVFRPEPPPAPRP